MLNRFKEARTTLNKHDHESVKEVSKATGITSSLIDDLETDKTTWEKYHKSPRDVGYSKIKTLAEHYGVSTDYLLGLSDQPTRDAQAAGAAEYTGLNNANVTRLHAIVEAIQKNPYTSQRERVFLYAINEIFGSQQFLIILERIWDAYCIEHTRAMGGLARKYPDKKEAAKMANEAKDRFNSLAYMGATKERIVSGDVAISVLLNDAREAISSISKDIIKTNILESDKEGDDGKH